MSESSTDELNTEKSKKTRKPRTKWTDDESRSVISIVNDLQILAKLDDKKCKKNLYIKIFLVNYLNLTRR